MLVNLLGNAIKFTERGEVELRTDIVHEQHDQVTLQFSIRDTGIGIPDDRLDSLFQSFTQLDASTRRKYGGTGLGLAISKNLVEAMGGQISVRSQEGVGSEFAFTVTFNKSSGERRRPRELPGGVESLHALVVEDNDANRHGLSEMLGAWGIDADAVANAHIALERLRSATSSGQSFDLAIIDQTLPDEDGATLAELIQADQHIHPLKVFLLTPLDSRLCCGGRREPDIERCLSKPVSQSHLLDAITDCFCGLACNRPEMANHHGAALAISPPLPAGTHVLLAEDQEINQFLAKEILTTQGLECDLAATGREAVEAVLTRRYDLVLMDCQMPEMDGLEATQRIRELESVGQLNGHLPIVALTANAIRGDRERCLQAGMDDYVAKPFNPSELIAAVQRLLAAAPEDGTARRTPECDGGPTARAATAPIDAETLAVHCMDDLALMERLLVRFQADGPERLKDIERHVAAGEATAVTASAHALKGMSAMLAAEGVRSLAADVETLARAGTLEDLEDVVGELRAELQRCIEYVPEIRPRPQPH